jgi:MFS family permease
MSAPTKDLITAPPVVQDIDPAAVLVTAPPPTGPSAVRQRVGRTMALVLTAAVGMYTAQLTLVNALSYRIATVLPDAKDAVYSTAVSLSALFLLITIPLGGAISDRTTSRFGRRRPWIVAGLIVALASTAVIGTATSAAMIIAGYVVGLAAMNLAFFSWSVIPIDALPDRMRGRVMGFMGMFGALAMSGGNYLASGLIDNQLLMMTAPILLAIVFTVPLLVAFRDPKLDKADRPTMDRNEMLRGFLVNPRRYPDFGWTWLSRFLSGIAMTAMFTYFIYFMMGRLGVGVADVGAKAGLLTLASAPVSVLFFVVSGFLSDKLGRRKPFIVGGMLLMSAALVLGALSPTFGVFLIAWLVFAMGQAMFLTVDLALCAAVLPNQDNVGKDMAVFGLALSVPAIIVPAVAPFVIGVGAGGNYALLWFIAAALCALGSLVVRRIRSVR